MALLRVGPLPKSALDAAARFHAEVLPKARALLPHPPRNGEVAARSADGGGSPPTPRQPADTSPPHAGEDLTLLFPSAPQDHRAWRLAAVQDLARVAAPVRVNGVVGDDENAIAETLAFLETALGVTGQLLAVEPA